MSASVAACCAAHPRSRGENLVHSSKTAVPQGSSPLTRGKLGAQLKNGGTSRLIPAHAGKTAQQNVTLIHIGAHPRSRGENRRRKSRRPCQRGSSPLTRGKLGCGFELGEIRGLIPAHAGKTVSAFMFIAGCPAHPRSRGENASFSASMVMRTGSSPLTRGKPAKPAPKPASSGLIPAHAGKTQRCGGAATQEGAHPRSRGENGPRLAAPWTFSGSSPLTRGKRRPLRGRRT